MTNIIHYNTDPCRDVFTNPVRFFEWSNSSVFDPDIIDADGQYLWISCLKKAHLKGMLYLLENGATLDRKAIGIIHNEGLEGLFLSTLLAYTNKDLFVAAVQAGIRVDTQIPTGTQPVYDPLKLRIEASDTTVPLIQLIAMDAELAYDDIYKYITLLLKFDADINQKDSNGNTILHNVSLAMLSNSSHDVPVLRFLLTQGADPGVVNKFEVGPLGYFESFIVNVLPEHLDSEVYFNTITVLNQSSSSKVSKSSESL